MKIFSMLAIAMIALSSCSTTASEPEAPKDTLKVMSWNIWHAGHSKAYPEKGCEGTLGILKHSGADVIMMIETYGASAQVADHLGYYHRLLSSNLSIYSRYPITRTFTFPDSIGTFNFGGVEIDMNGKKVRICDTWLHYLPDERLTPTDKSEAEILAWDDEGSRDDEIRTILNVMKPMIAECDSIPIIMGGDFNSHSHLDWTEATKDMYHHGGAVVNWTVSKEMEKAGFKDSFREVNPDPTKNLGTSWIHPQGEDMDGKSWSDKSFKQWRDDRIDYIYYKGAQIQAIESETYNANLAEMLNIYGKEFFYPSDHGLVLTTFKIKK